MIHLGIEKGLCKLVFGILFGVVSMHLKSSGEERNEFLGVMNRFSLSCASHGVSKLAALYSGAN
jgi:hypothetical protein